MTRISGKDWLIRSRDGRPSVYPSIGNWNLPCRSHYVIINGAVIWAGDFEPEDVEAVRVAKEKAEVVFAEKSSNEQKDELRERRLNKARRFWKKF